VPRFLAIAPLLSALLLPPIEARSQTFAWSTEADFLSGSLAEVEVDPAGSLGLTAAADWWDAAWAFRTPITVTEQSGNALTDYSVVVTLDTQAMIGAGTLEASGADLRFVDDLGTLLGHWIESGLDTPTTTVWVRVPSVPASGTATIWAYHGNPGAADVSSRADAMLWWDDFSSNSIADYESQGLNGHGNETWAISGGYAYNANDIYSYASLLVSGIDVDTDFLVETAATSDDNDGLGLVVNVDDSGSSYYSAQTWDGLGSRSGIGRSITEGDVTAPANVTIAVGSTHTYQARSHAGTLTMALDGTDIVSYSDPNPLTGGRLGMLSTLNNPAGYFDWLLVRRWVDPEPSAAPGDAEGQLATLGTWTSEVVATGCAGSTWDLVSWTEALLVGTDVSVAVRSGPTATPDGSWSAWSAELTDPAGSVPGIPSGGFAQVRVTLVGDGFDSPTVSQVQLEYTGAEDADGDGFASPDCGGTDCDDADPDVYPGAPEACNFVDDDCDGDVDEGFDADGDGWTTCGGDCNDTLFDVNPDAAEVCDQLDNDCDGDVDEGFDLDGDGYASCAGDCDEDDPSVNPGAAEDCNGIDDDCDGQADEDFDTDGDGWTTCGGDCNDTAPLVNPGASEICNFVDDDCDGDVDEGFDADGDGFTSCAGDCDDADPAVSPAATELCNGIDDNCDGVADEGFDADGDGVSVCEGDCDDGDPDVLPGAEEWCNGIDDDCDGTIDGPDALDALTWYADVDGDGFGDPGATAADCDSPPDHVDNGLDCDDGDAAVNPDAEEICNGIDDDCDPTTDELADPDGDGFSLCDGDCDGADPDVNPDAEEICDGIDNDCDPATDEEGDMDGDSWSICDDDCDDDDPAMFPGNAEICDGLDNDCDGAVPADELDGDGDGMAACEGDCDDADEFTYDGAPEQCDQIDNDCDGDIDEDVDEDTDGDGVNACQGDCDNDDAAVYPGAPEICDGKDNDCDGTLPDDEADLDGDGWSTCDGDCDDGDGDVSPDAEEVCDDGADNDCDGLADEDDDDCDTGDDDELTGGCECESNLAGAIRAPEAVAPAAFLLLILAAFARRRL